MNVPDGILDTFCTFLHEHVILAIFGHFRSFMTPENHPRYLAGHLGTLPCEPMFLYTLAPVNSLARSQSERLAPIIDSSFAASVDSHISDIYDLD